MKRDSRVEGWLDLQMVPYSSSPAWSLGTILKVYS